MDFRKRCTWLAGLATGTGMLAVAVAWAAPPDYAYEFGGPGEPEPQGLYGSASAIAIDADGNPWVADLHGSGDSRLVKFDYNGEFVTALSSLGDGRVPITTPFGLAADDEGFLYLAQSQSEPTVAKFDTGGRLVRTFRLLGGDGIALRGHKLDVGDDGSMFVSDGVSTVHVFSPGGEPLRRIELLSTRTVIDLAVAGDDLFIVFGTDTPNSHGILRYTTGGKFVRQLGPFSDVAFRELAVAPDGLLHVADYAGSVVRRFDPTGGEVDRYGVRGIGAGEMNGPNAIEIDCRGNAYVADSAARYDGPGGPRAGSKVLKYGSPGALPPPCAARPLPAGAIDTQVNDVEITQAVQPPMSYTAGPHLAPGDQGFTIPENRPRARAYGSDHNGAATGEVPLKAHLKTVVRVYANLNRGPPGGLGNIPATLEAVNSKGKRFGPIQAIARPALLRVGDRTVDATERTTPANVYTFDLPAEWTDDAVSLDLTARVNPAGLGCDQQCVNRSTFRLTGVPFGVVRKVPISPIALTEFGQPTVRSPARAFELARRVTPMLLDVGGYQAQAEVGDLLNTTSITVEECFLGVFPCEEDVYGSTSDVFLDFVRAELLERLEDAASDADIDRCDRIPFGLVREGSWFRGAMKGEFLARGFFPCAVGYAAFNQSLTVGHELQHALGRPHAGRSCPGSAEGDEQEGEPWPPDDRGLLGGIGLNTATRSPTARGPHQVIAPGVFGNPAEMFDLMSYCTKVDNDRWISPRGWRQLSNWRVGTTASAERPVTAARPIRRLRVTALELSDGRLAITGVSPTETPSAPADPSSPYVLEAQDSAGEVLASVRADADELSDSSSRLIRAAVPAPAGTTQLFLRRGDAAGARRVASPNPPKLRLRAPKRGARVAGRGALVKWKARDPDEGSLTIRIEYSANGGSDWRGVHTGPAEPGRAVIPRSLLPGSRNARFRIRVDDGFRQASVTSGRVKVAAAAPSVQITDPAGTMKIRADAPLELRGEAVAPGGKLLPGKRLRWFDGRRRLGRGAAQSLAGLSPGRHRIRLVATHAGATGKSELRVRVKSVKPAFLRLDAPRAIARKAKKVKLRVASTVPAELRVAGRRFRVSTRSRRIAVPARGRRAVALRLALKAGGRSARHTIRVVRRK